MKRILFAMALAAGTMAGAALTPLKHSDIPAHVAMNFVGRYSTGDDIDITVEGPETAAVLDAPSLSTSGWQINATASAGYKTPTFKTCAYDASEDYTDAGEEHTGTAHVSFDGAAANLYGVYVYDIAVEPETYLVTFNAGSGASVSPGSNTVTFDSAYGDLPTPTRTGYVFAGWWTESDGGTQVTSATTVSTASGHTLYAHWTPITYYVHFDANGGSKSMSNQTLTYDTSAQLTQNAFEKENYNFAGWTNMLTGAAYSDRQTVQNLTNEQSAVVTLTALWSGQMYTVYFHSNYGNDATTSDSFAYGAVCRLKAGQARNGYDFTGWATSPGAASASFAGGEEVNSSSLPFENGVAHLYAVWEAHTYTVAFDANGGSGSMSNQTLTYGDAQDELTLNAFSRTGYSFIGWAKSRTATEAEYEDGQAQPDVTAQDGKTVPLYAVWQPATYTVAFDANDAMATGEMESFSLAYGVVTNLPACAFAKDGYDFAGWTNLTDGAIFADEAAVSNLTATAGATVTLAATWKAQSYVVTFDANGGEFADGTDTTNVTVTVDEEYGELPVVETAPDSRRFGAWRFQTNGVWTAISSSSLVPPPSPGASNIVAQWLRETPIADALDIPTTQEIPFALSHDECDTNWTVVAEASAVGGTCLSATMPDRPNDADPGDPYADPVTEDASTKTITVQATFTGKGTLSFKWKVVSYAFNDNWGWYDDLEDIRHHATPEQFKFYVGEEFKFGMAASEDEVLYVTSDDDKTTRPVGWTPGWQERQIEIGAEGATTTVRWEFLSQPYNNNIPYSGGTAWLDCVQWTPEGGGGETPADVAVPVLAAKVYNGQAQTADIPASEDYSVVANVGGVDAGAYSVTLALVDADNTRWADGAQATRTVQWQISPRPLQNGMIAEIPAQEYTGSPVTPEVVVTNAELGVTLVKDTDYTLSFSNNEAAGVNTAVATVIGIGNYSGEISETFTITSQKRVVDVPEIASKVYDGQVQTADVPASADYEVVENAGGTDVGEYDVKLQLADSVNCEWSDGGSAAKTLKFSIVKATYDMSGAEWDYGGEFEYDGTAKTVEVAGLPAGVEASYTGNTAVEPGTYTAHATLTYDSKNYNEPSIGDLEWVIKANSAWTLQETFAGLGTVTSDAAGLKVVLTNDVSGTVELPDNLGSVTIDLNGHDMAGTDGDDAVSAQAPGGDGQPAIRIVAAEGEGAPTVIAVVNSQPGKASFSGGKGGEGTPPGNGGACIEAAEGTRPGVGVDIDEESVQASDGEGGSEWTRELVVGKYFKMTLVELGYDVPTDGTPYSVVAKGLPSGLKLKYNAAVKNKKGKVTKKAKVEWWIEGVPTAAVDYGTNPTYLVITANGRTETLALPLEVLAQEVKRLDDLALGQSMNTNGWLEGVGAGWTVSGLPTGLKYAAKKVTKKSGKKTVTVAEAYAVYGKTTKAGLFTITAKKKKGAFYETMKYRVLVPPKEVDTELFGDLPTNLVTMAYVPVAWDLAEGGSGRLGEAALPGETALPVVPTVAKVAGLPGGVAFASANVYSDKKKTKLKQYGQTIVGTPTKPGTNIVTFTKNVKSGKKTVAKTAQIIWTVVPNDAELSLGFNDAGGVIESGTVGLKYGDLLAFSATSNATVTASGLPKGMKLVKLDEGDGGHAGRVTLPGEAAWGFKGFTTKAGTYLVTVKAVLNGKVVTQRVALKVEGLPSWAKGTYNGPTCGPDGATNGLATITVSSVGKVSGKFQELGTNWTFSAASYTGYDPDATNYTVAVTAKYAYKVKSGKKTVTKYVTRPFALTVSQGGFGGVATLDGEDGSTVAALQNLWGGAYKAVGKRLFSSKSGKKMLAYKVFAFDGAAVGLEPQHKLSLKVTTAGAATATLTFDTGKTKKDKKTKKTVKVYYKPTCKTVVVPTSAADAEPFTCEAILYFAPSAANGFPGCAGTIGL